MRVAVPCALFEKRHVVRTFNTCEWDVRRPSEDIKIGYGFWTPILTPIPETDVNVSNRFNGHARERQYGARSDPERPLCDIGYLRNNCGKRWSAEHWKRGFLLLHYHYRTRRREYRCESRGVDEDEQKLQEACRGPTHHFRQTNMYGPHVGRSEKIDEFYAERKTGWQSIAPATQEAETSGGLDAVVNDVSRLVLGRDDRSLSDGRTVL